MKTTNPPCNSCGRVYEFSGEKARDAGGKKRKHEENPFMNFNL